MSKYNEQTITYSRNVEDLQLTFRKHVRNICIYIILFTNFVTATSCCAENELYIIRNVQEKGFVLDASEESPIRIQHFTGFATQLWQFEPANSPAEFYIISNYTGKVLDFATLELFLSEKKDVPTQKWTISLAGQIFNVGKPGHVVDIRNGNFSYGNVVQIWEENDTVSQKFLFLKKV